MAKKYTIRLYSGWDRLTWEGHLDAAAQADLGAWYEALPYRGNIKVTFEQALFLLREAKYAEEYNRPNGKTEANPYGNECPSAKSRGAALKTIASIELALSDSIATVNA
jgi:hypothetical protein